MSSYNNGACKTCARALPGGPPLARFRLQAPSSQESDTHPPVTLHLTSKGVLSSGLSELGLQADFEPPADIRIGNRLHGSIRVDLGRLASQIDRVDEQSPTILQG